MVWTFKLIKCAKVYQSFCCFFRTSRSEKKAILTGESPDAEEHSSRKDANLVGFKERIRFGACREFTPENKKHRGFCQRDATHASWWLPTYINFYGWELAKSVQHQPRCRPMGSPIDTEWQQCFSASLCPIVLNRMKVTIAELSIGRLVGDLQSIFRDAFLNLAAA